MKFLKQNWQIQAQNHSQITAQSIVWKWKEYLTTVNLVYLGLWSLFLTSVFFIKLLVIFCFIYFKPKKIYYDGVFSSAWVSVLIWSINMCWIFSSGVWIIVCLETFLIGFVCFYFLLWSVVRWYLHDWKALTTTSDLHLYRL